MTEEIRKALKCKADGVPAGRGCDGCRYAMQFFGGYVCDYRAICRDAAEDKGGEMAAAEWIGEKAKKCSACGAAGKKSFAYCPGCGARMEAGK